MFQRLQIMILKHVKNNNRIDIIVIKKIVEFVIKIIYYLLTQFCTILIKHFYFFNLSKILFHKQKAYYFKFKTKCSNNSSLKFTIIESLY